jgi:methylmalonyl-CoA mutase
MLQQLIDNNKKLAQNQIQELQNAAIQNQNIFEVMMEAAKVCSLGQITHSLFEVGGQYRRNM